MYIVEKRRAMFAVRFSHIHMICSLVIFLFYLPGTVVSAQDPFATPVSGNPTPPPAANQDPVVDQTAPPTHGEDIVKAIRQSNPTTSEQLAKAIGMMLDINREDEALRYLQQLSALENDDQAWHEFHRKQGPAFLIRLQHSEGLQGAGNQFAERIFAISRRLTTDPARLRTLVEQVFNGQPKEKIAAGKELITIGPNGAAALAREFADPGKSDRYELIRSMIRSMGATAEPVLIAAARSGNPQLAKEAIGLLAQLNSPSAMETLIGLKARSAQNKEIEMTVDQAIASLTETEITDAQLKKSLFSFVNRYLDDRHLGASEQTKYQEIWIWDNDAQEFVSRTVRSVVIRRSRAADFAKDLLALDPTNDQAIYLSALSEIEARRLIVGLDQPAGSIQELGIPDGVDPEFLKRILSGALDRDLVGAAVSTCDAFGLLGSEVALASNQGRPSALARALEHGNPRIRAAATQAIIKIDPQKSFAGSSNFVESLIYLAGTMGYPKAMIAHNSPMMAQTFAAGIEQSGMISHSVNTSQDCFREATQDSDFEILFITDTLDRPDYAELIQQLRHESRTRKTPIGLLARPENMHRAEIIAARDEYTLAMPWTRDPRSIALFINRLRNLGTTVIDPSLRIGYAKMAMDALEKYTSDPKRYSMFDFRSHQQALSFALLSPEVAQQACVVMGEIGTPFAQRQLINLANQSDLELEIRQKAVDSLRSAVSKHGLMLTSAEIRYQFDRYNASLKEAESSRKILGEVLDIIEGRKAN